MIRSPEQQFAFAKRLPIQELAKVLQGQSDVVDMSIAEMVLRQKTQAQKAQQGMAAQQMAQSPKVVEKDLMEAGVAAMSAPNMEQMDGYAGGGIVAFQPGGAVGAPLQSTRIPGPGPTFASAFPNVPAAASAASRMPGLFGRIGSLALGPMMMFESMTGPSPDDVTRLREFDAAKEILKQAGFTDKDIAALSSQDIKRMAAGYVNRHTAPVAPAQTAPAAPAAPGSSDQAPPPALKRTEEGIARLVAPKLPMPAELTPAEAGRERLDYYKSLGISQDPFKTAREMIEKDRATDAEARREAGWSRLLEAGLGIMGGESPYAFTNIGKGAQAAARGAAEDMKDFRKLERDRKKEEARLAIDQNNYLKSGADSDLAKVEKRRDTISAIGIKQAELEKDIAVANATLESQRLTRRDTRDLQAMQNARESARRQVEAYVRLNPGVTSDKNFDYEGAIDTLAARLYSTYMRETPVTTPAPSGPRGKVVNGVYVPAGR